MDRDDAAPTVELGSLTGPSQDGSEAPEDLTGRRLGDYVVKDLIGLGGFGAVYRAEQLTLAREVVVKVLRKEVDDKDVRIERFLREAQLASRLDHPYAAHIYAFGAEPDGLLWIAMELVRGTSLEDLLASQGALSIRRFTPLLEKLCEVVYTAHQQGMVHRDIKPSNVMVLSRAGQLLPKLLDFGIARLAEELHDEVVAPVSDAAPSRRASSQSDGGEVVRVSDIAALSGFKLTRRGLSLGSPPYMAPEQWVDASRSDDRTDQYGLAILAYEAITGRVPFRARSAHQMAMAHAKRAVPPLGDEFPSALDEVLTRALAKNQAERYDNVLEFAAGFRAAAGLGGERPVLPEMDPFIREAMIAEAPPPLADAVTLLEASQGADRALAAVRKVVEVIARLLGLWAVAGLSQTGVGQDDADTEAVRASLRELRTRQLTTQEWLACARSAVARFAERADAHPLPELVLLFHATGGHAVEMWVTKLGELTDPASDADATGRLGEALPTLARLLKTVSFLCAYPIVVKRVGRTERWMGARRAVRPAVKLSGERKFADGAVVVTDREGDPVMSLSPIVQVLVPAPGASDEMFLYDGPGRFGARLLAYPAGFERHDSAIWDWFRQSFAAQVPDLEPDEGVEAEAAGAAITPYLGLSSFAPDDAGNYFGRERETEACVNRLLVQTLLAVVGPSGAGKSSFVQAGVIPRLPEGWRAVTARPGPSPVSALCARLARAGMIPGDASTGEPPGADLRDLIIRKPATLGRVLRDHVRIAGRPLVVVIDQFEELLTLCPDRREQVAYAEALTGAARTPDDRVRVILTLRDDFLLRAQQLAPLRERLTQSLVLLATPPPEDLERIVVEPARRAGYEFDDAELPGEMVAAVAAEPSALALLSFTASVLWEQRDRHFRRLTRRAYEALGGVGGALAQHAEATLAAMPQVRQHIVREVFRQLVTADGTRAILSRRELVQVLSPREAGDRPAREGERDNRGDRRSGADAARAEDAADGARQEPGEGESGRASDEPDDAGADIGDAVLEDLIAARLLVASEGERGEDRVELVHEALLSSWPRLVKWQREDAESARLRDQLRAAARQWEERGRPAGLLWRGDALLEYRVWRARYRGSLTDNEEAFTRASLREEASGRRRRRVLVVVAFAVLAVGLVVLFEQRERADAHRVRAEAAREQAEAAREQAEAERARANDNLRALYREQGRQGLLSGEPQLAFPYLLEARRSGEDGAGLRFLIARARDALAGQLLAIPAHRGPAWVVRFSPDGTRLLSAGEDNRAVLWDASTGEALHELAEHSKQVWTAAFSPDGARVVTGSFDGDAIAWDVATGGKLWTAPHDRAVMWLGVSPGGSALATACADGKVRIWDMQTGALHHTLTGHTAPVTAGSWSPDERLLVTGSIDETARIWNPRSGALVATVGGHRGMLSWIEFSRDGTRVVTASFGGISQIFSPTGGGRIVLSGHTKELFRARFSRDGTRVVTASEDQAAIVWDARSGQKQLVLEGHAGGVLFAGFDAGGARIATASRDGSVRLWDARTGRPIWRFLGHEDGVWTAQWAPDGDRIASSGIDGTVRVWDAAQMSHLRAVNPRGDVRFRHAALAPDGQHVATLDTDGVARVWNGEGAPVGEPMALHASYTVPARVAWSPDGEHVIAPSGTRAIAWDWRTGKVAVAYGRAAGGGGTHDLENDPDVRERAVTCAAYDRAGRRVVTASMDGTARIWDADTGESLRVLERDSKDAERAVSVTYAEFSPAGDRVVTASDDLVARVWDANTGALLRALTGHSGTGSEAGINTARFSADGAFIITAAEDKTAKVWNAATGESIATLVGHGDAVKGAALHPSGQLAATASEDRSVRIWEVATSKLLWSFDLQPSRARDVQFTADGRALLTISEEAARLWRSTLDDSSIPALEAFSACRVGYVVDKGGVKRTAIDLAACNDKNQ